MGGPPLAQLQCVTPLGAGSLAAVSMPASHLKLPGALGKTVCT